MTMNLNMSRVYRCEAATLFKALSEGVLFRATGAKDGMKIDFREGGHYELAWDGSGPVTGVFHEITPDRRIVMSWDYDSKDLGQRVETQLELLIEEHDGVCTLSLNHTGFPSAAHHLDHDEGWRDAMKDFTALMREVAKRAGLDLHFRMAKLIQAPVAQVFAAVRDKAQLETYFPLKCSGDFQVGAQLIWDFEGLPPFTLHVHQVEENKLIKFRWDDSHVCLSFADGGDGRTRVTVDVTGFSSDQQGLEDSYSECDGWMDFLWRLKIHTEKAA